MKVNKVNLVYYSPTNTTKQVLEAIASTIPSITNEIINNNITLPDYLTKLKPINSDELVIVGMPVYAGRVPIEALERFEKLTFNNNPVVLVAVYGNRHFDDSLIELQEISKLKGMTPIAAGAFIGEHSYSSSEFPIAINRPDSNDIKIASNFGKEISLKLENLSSISDIKSINIPGQFPLPDRKALSDAYAETDYNNCTLCQRCIEVCPTGAISFTDKIVTNNDLCNICCACIKECPYDARTTKSEQILKFQKMLFENFSKRKEPEIFM